MHSYKDIKGRVFVACCECTRGGNGSDPDKCSAGWKHKRFRGAGCFVGTLMPQFKDKIKVVL